MKVSRLGVIFLVYCSMLFFAQVVNAENVITGVDEESQNDKVLLHGTIVNLKGRMLYLKDVNPLCRKTTVFKIRNFDRSVPLVKGGTTWFWMIGDCRSKESVIDIVAKPKGGV